MNNSPPLLTELGLDKEQWLASLLAEEGLWETFKLASNVLDGKPDWEEGVRMDKIADWLGRIFRGMMLELVF